MEIFPQAPDWIAHHAQVAPDAPACHDLHSGRQRSYREFDQRISRLAWHLRIRAGLEPGARVLVLSRNDIDVFEVQFACQRSCTVFVPLNWRLAASELLAIADDAKAQVLVYGAEFRETALQLAAAAAIGTALEMACGRDSPYEEAIAQADPTFMPDSAPGSGEPWALIYTSGTTGRAKGVQVSYRMALCNAVALGLAFHITAQARNLVVLPLFHTGGLNVFANPVFFHGGANIVVRDFDPAQVIQLLSPGATGATHMLAVPTMHAMLLEHPDFSGVDTASLRHVAVAGAPCPVGTIEGFARRGIELRQCWGMTEAGPLALLAPRGMPAGKLGSSGLPGMFVEARVIGVDARPVPGGEVGELQVKGPCVTSGYWQRPEADAVAFTSDGWLRTGDAARRDEDGFFYIVDRWKDMYISGGENVYPAEIERALAGHAAVAESAVIGIQDEKWGEVGRAFVVAREGLRLDADELRAHCEGLLARYKIPREFVVVESLPHGASGKVLKNELRKIA